MKNTLRILALVLCLVLTASLMVACGKDSKKDDTKDTTAAVETEPVELIDEATAKEIVWADLNIQETAAENLTVEFKDNTYVIAFDWSGFDYQYTVNAATGVIDEILFDGSPLW